MDNFPQQNNKKKIMISYVGEDGSGLYQYYPKPAYHGDHDVISTIFIENTITQENELGKSKIQNTIDVTFPIIDSDNIVIDLIENPPLENFNIDLKHYQDHDQVNFGFLLVPGMRYFKPKVDQVDQSVIPLIFSDSITELKAYNNKFLQFPLEFDWTQFKQDLLTIPEIRHFNQLLQKDLHAVTPIQLNVEIEPSEFKASDFTDKFDDVQYLGIRNRELVRETTFSAIAPYWKLVIKISSIQLHEMFKSNYDIETIVIDFNVFNLELTDIFDLHNVALDYQFDDQSGRLVFNNISPELVSQDAFDIVLFVKSQYLRSSDQIKVEMRVQYHAPLIGLGDIDRKIKYISPTGLPISPMIRDEAGQIIESETSSHLSTIEKLQGNLQGIAVYFRTCIDTNRFLPEILAWHEKTVKINNTELLDIYHRIEKELTPNSLDTIFKIEPNVEYVRSRLYRRVARIYTRLTYKNQEGYLDMKFLKNGKVVAHPNLDRWEDHWTQITFSYSGNGNDVKSVLSEIIDKLILSLGGVQA